MFNLSTELPSNLIQSSLIQIVMALALTIVAFPSFRAANLNQGDDTEETQNRNKNA